jgi:gamma-glutamyltranspeptidase/glutathione hydrolase
MPPFVKSPGYFFAAAFVLLTCGCGAPTRPQPGRVGMVVSADSQASAIGLSVMQKGGNAVDAAVAVGFALAVTFPEAGNIGGGGFLLIRMTDGTARSIDFRETAPLAATPSMFSGRPESSVDGALASGTPGTVAGLLLALDRYGTKDRRELIRPAIDLAARGITVTPGLAASLLEYRVSLSRHPATRAVFFRDSLPVREGDILTQPDLARTLGLIADSGMVGFYGGRTAALIDAHVKNGGGILSRADLAAYRAIEREPLRGTYRGYTVDAMGPPSSGGLCLLRALSLLEPYDLGSQGFHSTTSVHLITEAMKRSFSMRAAYLGDADFVDVPVDRLLSPPGGAGGIDHSRAAPPDSIAGYPWVPREGQQTTHYSVVDGQGMAVAVTYTVNDLFGNKEIVGGAGFFMNDQMDDFVIVPGAANMYGLVGGPENMIEPGKRPLSSMCPTIVSKDGRPVLILGARGGSRIITAVLQCIINIVDYGLSPERAVAAPRFHHQWSPDRLSWEEGALSGPVSSGLSLLGHRIAGSPVVVGAVQAVYIDPETQALTGMPDPREGGSAAGY